MAEKPSKFPDWATEDQIDPVSGQPNTVEPPDARKQSGWTREEIPPRQWFNWLARLTAEWLRWVEEQVADLGTAATKDVEDDGGTVVETQNLGTAARRDVGTGSENVPDIQAADSRYLQSAIWLPTQAATVSWSEATAFVNPMTGSPRATPAHTSMRRCVVNNAGVVQYYLDERNSTLREDGVTPADLTGADGEVMVEILPFYVRTEIAAKLSSWSVSAVPLPGYVLHPAFAGGVEATYIGAYEAVAFDVSAGNFLNGLNADDNTARMDFAADTLHSVNTPGGHDPMVGLSRAQFRTLAGNNGFQLMDFWQWQAVLMLYLTEYGIWDSLAAVGAGNGNKDHISASPHKVPGLSNSVGNRSGGTVGTEWMSYRGIEHLWGDARTIIDGVNIQSLQPYVSNNEAAYADTTTAGYSAIGGALPNATGADNRIWSWHPVENAFLVRTVNANTAIPDYYASLTTGEWQIMSVGGDAGFNPSQIGIFCTNLDVETRRQRAIGTRIAKKRRAV